MATIADLQSQAQSIYNQTGNWSDPRITALHNQVTALQSGSGNTFNSSTGTWGTAPKTTSPTPTTTYNNYQSKTATNDYDRTLEAINSYRTAGDSTKLASALQWANMQGYNLNPTTQAPAATTTTPPKVNTSYFPGQDTLSSMLSNMPRYNPLSESQMQAQAQSYADLQLNPQATALQKSLQNALTALANQENSVNANYAGLQTSAEEAKKSAAKRALESAVARGGGRAGAVEWETAEATKPIDAALMQAEASKTAELNNLANNRTLAQQSYDTSIEGLEAQRGALLAQQLAAIKERDYALQTGDWERATSLQTTISQLATQQNNTQNQLNYQYANLMGQMPEGINGTNGMGGSASTPSSGTGSTGLRDYVTSKGGTVSWDQSTGNVSVNGKSYSPSQLQGMGAVLANGKWVIPQSVANYLL